MPFNNFDNSSTPRLTTRLNDRVAATNEVADGKRVLVAGFCKPAKNAVGDYIVPVQELYPAVSGTIPMDQLIKDTQNYTDDVIPVAYPSEISIQLEELRDAGVSNVQVVNLGYDARFRDMDGVMARERYIGLVNAYELILDMKFDFLVPCNVVAGMVGDTKYSNSDYSLIYDIELYEDVKAANPIDPRLSYTSIPGYVQMQGDSEYARPSDKTLNVPEDLVYLTALACDMIVDNGYKCEAILRSMNPIEVKALGELYLGASVSATGSLKGIDITAAPGSTGNMNITLEDDPTITSSIVDNVVGSSQGPVSAMLHFDFSNTGRTLSELATAIASLSLVNTAVVGSGFSGTDSVSIDGSTDSVTLSGGADGVNGSRFGSSGASSTRLATPTWGLLNTGSGAASDVFADYDFANADSGMSGDAVLDAIQDLGYFVDKATNKGGIKSIYKETAKPKAGVNGATQKDVLAWSLVYGKPSVSETNKWGRFLKGFGNGADAALFKNNVCSYLGLDGKTSTEGNEPDNFLYYRTTHFEKPLSNQSIDIVTDDNGTKVDLGKHINMIAANSVFIRGDIGASLNPSAPGYVNFLAGCGLVAGWCNTLPSNIATTRQTTGSYVELSYLGSKMASQLTRQGYQLFSTREGVYTFGRDITMAVYVSETARSEYINQMTGRIVADAVGIANLEAERLLGKEDSVHRREGLRQAIQNELNKWVRPEDGRLREIPFVRVWSSATGAVVGAINIELGLAVANEILEVNTVINIRN